MVVGPAIRGRALSLWLIASLALGVVLSSAVGMFLSRGGKSSLVGSRLQYYSNYAKYTVSLESRATYQAQIDGTVNRNLRVVRGLARLPKGRLLVWGNAPWLYVLSNRLPATPYTSAMRWPQVPGEPVALRRAVESAVPSVVVVIRPARPSLKDAAKVIGRNYKVAFRTGNAVTYVRVH